VNLKTFSERVGPAGQLEASHARQQA
jgi:hypothetical protein